ncbi:MAG TPA: SDR family NAD(P)-dependent oxidoreductase [Candidatus Baltobacteraceae bacterium]
MTSAKVLIITGASSGIGWALTDRAVRAGYNVLAIGRRAQRLEELQAELVTGSGELATLAIDLRSPGAARRIVRTAMERFGRIDVIVNNAGTGAAGEASMQSDEALHEQFDTHVIVPVELVREARHILHATHGQVFFVGSGVARIPIANYGVYPSAKAAMRSVSRILRNELRAENIAVTYVDPGVVMTEFHTRLGYQPPRIAVSPHRVARKILNAVAKRPAIVNAVPWQTFAVGIGERMPALVDFVLSRVPAIAGVPSAGLPAPVTAKLGGSAPEPPANDTSPSPFDAALAPLASRMHRLKLAREYVAALLVPGSELDAGAVALRWAGMPNKNERGIVRDVLDALADHGVVERLSEETYRVP